MDVFDKNSKIEQQHEYNTSLSRLRDIQNKKVAFL